MKSTRRQFIKTGSAGTIGLLFMPSFSETHRFFENHSPVVLPRSSPELQGISSKSIRNFIHAIKESGIQWHSFMLLRHGNVVAEGWWKPFDAHFKHTLYSLSKSFTSSAIGLLVKDGKLNVTDSVISYFPHELPAEINDNLKKMQVKHLLTMNSGHSEDTIGKMRDTKGKTWTKTYLELAVPFEPGSHFLYNTGNTYMLGAIVHKITGKTLAEFLGPRLLQPLGIAEYDWEVSPDGLNTAGYGLRIKTEDIAKFGQLYLQKGKWSGKEILSPAWVNEATRFQTNSQEGNGDWAQGYGYQFWRCKPGFYRGDGAFGQFCIVMPEQDAVLAITSESWDMQKSMTTAWDNLLPAMQSTRLPENAVELAGLKKELNGLMLPVVKGSTTSALMSKFNGRKYRMDSNDFDVREMQFSFSGNGCVFKTKMAKREVAIQFGWEKWVTGIHSISYPFPVPQRLHVPSRIAGTATWINQDTLQLDAKFVEAIHGDKITCTFNDNKIVVSFLNSVAENTKNTPEKRKDLSGSYV